MADAAEPVRDSDVEPAGPRPIRRLDEQLVNRIAAGEIIHRPSSALKELLENCLDAGAKRIRVTVKDGGMKLLQIEDDGCGIRKSDLAILCERFTTSKLVKFSDLASIATYGFRGEALASISHVAHLSVTTKTKDDTCAWSVSYADGRMVPSKPGLSADPKPTAGNDGTVEDLFYNTPTRQMAIRSASEEYSRILDIVTRYAVHNPTVSFMCKKAGSSTPDISTPSSSDTVTLIKLLYGASIAREIINVTAASNDHKSNLSITNDKMDEDQTDVEWKAEAFVTNANYHVKKMGFLLFINHRAVESSRIKKAVDSVYSSILPKGTSPFVYLSLTIDPANVDVNVHPTKREVHFLNEDEITEAVMDAIQFTLVNQGSSRTFQYQTITAPELRDRGPKSRQPSTSNEAGPSTPAVTKLRQSSSSTPLTTPKIYPQHKIRGSAKNGRDRTLDSMFPTTHPSQMNDDRMEVDIDELEDDSGNEDEERPRKRLKMTEIKSKSSGIIRESECFLTSVLQLREEVKKNKHARLSEVLQDHAFVGIVDLQKSISLVQHSKQLYIVNHAVVSEELFYQLGLREFGDMSKIKLEPPPSIKALVQLAVESDDDVRQNGLDAAQLTEKIVNILMERRELVEEYFSLVIDDQGNLQSLPLLLRNYTPNLDRLPLFLMRLGPRVNWNSEKECFETFLRELAYFYAAIPSPPSPNNVEQEEEEEKAERWQIEHVLFRALKAEMGYFVAPKTLLEHSVVQVASLPDLYKVFERC